MYESFFELREKPFSLLPDPSFLFMSHQHQQALTLLEYGLLNQAGFIILTGEIGSGKTTLMRYLLTKLDPSYTIGLISNTHQSLGDLMDWVCMALDLQMDHATKLEKYQAFVDFVIDKYAKGQRVLLIVDEAQNLGIETLEELRLLSNINADKDLVLQLMLLGQPQLRDLLRHPDLEQFAQRVSSSYHLGPIGAKETESYIRHRILIAGGTHKVFTQDACDAVHHYSKGIPRLINLICDTAFVYAYGAGERIITGDSIDEVIRSYMPNLIVSINFDEHLRATPSALTNTTLTPSEEALEATQPTEENEATITPTTVPPKATSDSDAANQRHDQPAPSGINPRPASFDVAPSGDRPESSPQPSDEKIIPRPLYHHPAQQAANHSTPNPMPSAATALQAAAGSPRHFDVHESAAVTPQRQSAIRREPQPEGRIEPQPSSYRKLLAVEEPVQQQKNPRALDGCRSWAS